MPLGWMVTALITAAFLASYASSAVAVPGDSTWLVSAPAGAIAEPSPLANTAYLWNQAVSDNGRYVAFSSAGDGLSPLDDNRYSNVFVRDTLTGTTTLVSIGYDGRAARGSSGSATISADGRHVAFTSSATNLLPSDANRVTDVFVRDLATGAITLVSRADGPLGALSNSSSGEPAISADGNRVLFTSSASNLPGANAYSQVYVRDIGAGTTTLASRSTGPTGASAKGADQASLSGDGRRVVFRSAGLDPSEVPGVASSLYLRDLDAGATGLVSRASDAAGAVGAPANGNSYVPWLDYDGSRVAFTSYATNLGPAAGTPNGDVFVRDLVSGTTMLVSRGPGIPGAVGDGESFADGISSDGNRVAMSSYASNFGGVAGWPGNAPLAYIRDIAAGTTTLASAADGPAGLGVRVGRTAMSRDGSAFAFHSSYFRSGSTAGDFTQVFVRHLDTSETQWVSRPSDSVGYEGGINVAGLSTGSISADGRYVAFLSKSDGLSSGDDDKQNNVFVRDNATGSIRLVSVSSSGLPQSASATAAVISADGQAVAWLTAAGNLDPADKNRSADVYVRNLATGTTTVASRADGAAGSIAGGVSGFAIDGDGSRVAFATTAQLSAADGAGTRDVFIRDLASARTLLASRADGATGAAATGSSDYPSLSNDGERVAFNSAAANLSPAAPSGGMFVRDVAAGTTILASRADGAAGAAVPVAPAALSISGDGTRVAFSTPASIAAGDPGGTYDVYVRDVAAGATVLASRADGASGAAASAVPVGFGLDSTGNRVVFMTNGINLVPGDKSTRTRVYVRDLAAATTILAGRADGASGALPSGAAKSAALSGNGNCVAWATAANNLTPSFMSSDFVQVYERALGPGCG